MTKYRKWSPSLSIDINKNIDGKWLIQNNNLRTIMKNSLTNILIVVCMMMAFKTSSNSVQSEMELRLSKALRLANDEFLSEDKYLEMFGIYITPGE